MQTLFVAASPRSIAEYDLPVRRSKTRGKPEGAGQIVGVRELKQRHFAELLHRLPGQAARSIVETEYLQNCELASRNCPSAARIAWGTGF